MDEEVIYLGVDSGNIVTILQDALQAIIGKSIELNVEIVGYQLRLDLKDGSSLQAEGHSLK